jgi:ectoine hydroxylase-related dioxygenase (phytanoyl-CoA dioxygenase family)
VRAAIQQCGAEVFLEDGDALPDRGRRQVLRARGAGDGALLGDTDQALEVTNIQFRTRVKVIKNNFTISKGLNVIYLLNRVLASFGILDHVQMNYRDQYQQQGYLAPIDVLDVTTAASHRQQLEQAERKIGPLHYLSKIHTVLTSPARLAAHPAVPDLVEQLIGPDILVYNATYIVKEAGSPAHVTWHQDLTYWGLDRDDQVSLWLALSETSVESGCMRVIPGSHVEGRKQHLLDDSDKTNVLLQGQRVTDVDESQAVACPLRPGQASLHHGWLLHASAPNRSSDRRIGLNVQYVAPQVRQTKLPGYSAWLVRGEDRYHHYAADIPAEIDLDADALARRSQMERLHRNIAGTANP